MQLNTRQIVVNNQNRWVVTVDGVAEAGIGYGTKALAFERMDALWARRPQADKAMEALYVGRD
jgi:hypothetical protein